MKPEDAATMQLIADVMNHITEIADAITRGDISHGQFEHVAENIRQLKLALLNRRPRKEP